MKVNDVKFAINEKLADHIIGFKHKKSEFSYVKKTGEIHQIFLILVHAKTEWFLVESCVLLASPRINKIFNIALGRAISTTGSTCGFAVNHKFPHRGSYDIDCESDVDSVVENLNTDFTEIALPFFENNQTISDLEKYMNYMLDNGCYRPMSVDRACLGIIAAKICENPDFEKICDDYYEFCKKSQGPILADPILIVRRYLEQSSY